MKANPENTETTAQDIIDQRPQQPDPFDAFRGQPIMQFQLPVGALMLLIDTSGNAPLNGLAEAAKLGSVHKYLQEQMQAQAPAPSDPTSQTGQTKVNH